MNQDINFTVGDNRFNFRVGAFICNNGRILLQKSDSQDFYNLVGGRVKLNESTYDAVIRETEEEIGIRIKDAKLIRVVENFFNWMGKNVQELLFVYYVELDDNYSVTKLDKFNVIDSEDEVAQWFDVNEIGKLNCKPEVIKELYSTINGNIVHEIGVN